MSTLIELIAEGENLHQDFKFSIDNLRKIARTLCAFANTDGGRLLIGINDKRKIVGCNPQEELHMIQESAKHFCNPEISFTSKIWQEDFRMVLEIDIAISDQGPHRAKDDNGNWRSYIRIKDHTTAANKILEGVWAEQKKHTAQFDKLNEEQTSVLKIIQDEQSVTLSQLYKKSNLALRKVDQTVVLLVYWGVVEMVFESDGIFYRIADNDSF
jgi:predicted HTH transcriptional regulator